MAVLAMAVPMEAWVMARAMVMADMNMAATIHIAVGDTGPPVSTEQIVYLFALFRLIQLVPNITFPLLLEVY